jgi:hypothetical protein
MQCFTDTSAVTLWEAVKKVRRRQYRGRVCSRCETVLKDVEILEDDDVACDSGKRVDLNLGSLRKSAEEACYICAAIWNVFKESAGCHEPENLEKELSTQITYQLRKDQTERLELDIEFSVKVLPLREPLKVEKLFILHAKSGLFDPPPTNKKWQYLTETGVSKKLGRITAQSTDSEESSRTYQKWMRQCKDHPICLTAMKENLDSYKYPTRLIDVSTKASMGKVHLCDDFSGDSSRVPYAALSHCWGTAEFKCLKIASYNDFKDGVAAAGLALTFRGAIEVTRRLGLKYLWIDSLCIKQDSPDDWQSEAARMRDIYAGSCVTIAATHSDDSDQSLFADRRPETLNSPMIDLRQRKSAPGKYYIVDHASWNSEIQDSPLDARGWVLQERLLSPRVLHFGNRQLIWECLQKDATETLPLGLLPGRTPMGDAFRFKDFLPSVDLNRATGHRSMTQFETQWWPYILWGQVVENYSKRQLSHPVDKLIAISGIAQMFYNSFSCPYVAGLWRKEIEKQLLWHLDDVPDVEPLYRAPSWSWASVDGGICQPRCLAEASIVAKVRNVEVKNVTDNVYGMVKEGTQLEIEGQLQRITLGLPNTATMLDPASKYMETVEGRFMAQDSRVPPGSLDPEVRLDHLGEAISEACELYCMPVYYDETVQELRGLILTPEGVQGRFKRVGTFWSWEPKNIGVILSKRNVNGYGSGQDDKNVGRMTKIIIV